MIVTTFTPVSMFSEGSLGDHVNVRRPFAPASEELMSRSYHGGLDQARHRDTGMTRDMMSQSVMAGTEIKTIEHSLALIRNHVKVTIGNASRHPHNVFLVRVWRMSPPTAVCRPLRSLTPPPPPSCAPPPPPLATWPWPRPRASLTQSQTIRCQTQTASALSPGPSTGTQEIFILMKCNCFRPRFGFSRVSKPRTLGMGVTAQDRIMPQVTLNPFSPTLSVLVF